MSTDTVLNLYKERGETPLECINRFRKANKEYRNVPLSYVGRLDPMAEGVLLVLSGEENKQRAKYLSLEKEYTCDILFGFATDTYDILGELTGAVTRASHKQVSTSLVLEYVSMLEGTRSQKYPPYSSKPLDGVPLFVKARKGELEGLDLPEHEITIKKVALTGTRRMKQEDLLEAVTEDIGKVRGDFRQERILALWEDTLRVLYGMEFDIASISVACSTGTYIRSLADELGTKVGVPALAYRIVRTKVGKWKIKDSIR